MGTADGVQGASVLELGEARASAERYSALHLNALVAGVDSGGGLFFVSGSLRRFVGFGREAEMLARLEVRTILGPAAFAERRDLALRAAETGLAQHAIEFLGGCCCRTIITPMGVVDGRGRCFTVSITPHGSFAEPISPTPAGAVEFDHPVCDRLRSLTNLELQVLRRVAAGNENREIAAEMCRTIRAVEWHTRSLLKKLGLAGRRELVLAGRGAGLNVFADAHWARILRQRTRTRPRNASGVASRDDRPHPRLAGDRANGAWTSVREANEGKENQPAKN